MTSKVLCDGKAIEGVQELQYKITRNRANVHTVGSHERISGFGTIIASAPRATSFLEGSQRK